ncbi:MAG: VIT domain-containing protein [Kofleriaceae bacterium]
MKTLPLAVVSWLVVLVVSPRPAGADASDRSLTPYFVVEGERAGAQFPLERTDIDAKIAGVIADVVLRQTYHNGGDKPINAQYVFPASTRAAVYGMKMTIGQRVIEARIKEREAARQEFEQAKREGKSASLLEQDRPNIFSMSVANILPGERVFVELRYTELLVPSEGVYELVVPTVVGPRYGAPAKGAASGAGVGYLPAGSAPPSPVSVQVAVAGGMPIQSLESPSHPLAMTWAQDRTTATLALKDPASAGDRDFVLRYRLSGSELASGLLLYPGDKENFFLMMVQPPQRPAPELIPPREYVFIVDVSGSMTGFPLDVTKRLMRDLLTRLRPTDRFNLLLFAGDSRLYAPESVPANATQIDAAIAYFDAQQSGGGTELLPAMQRALALPAASAKASRSFVVITDGYISEEPELFEHIRDHLGDANVFSFGIGSSVNRHLIDGVAKAGQGEPFVVLSTDEADRVATKFRDYIESPVLTQVKASFQGFDAYDVAPASLPDVFAQRPVVVFGKWRGAPQGQISLTGVSGRGRFVNTFDVRRHAPQKTNSALRYLWARSKISELSDFSAEDANRDAVVKLGLEYNLLTRFTSFIAVLQVVRTDGRAQDVAQPQPLPAGVPEEAVGMEIGAEPPLLVVIGLMLAAIAWRSRRRVARRGAW